MNQPLYAGVDVGSSTTKAVLLDETQTVVGRAVCRSGASFERAAELVLEEALQQAKRTLSEVTLCFSTGYGRRNVPFAQESRTEIACHARGAYQFAPRAITVVDIGGQDNKVIRLDANGHRIDFKMNRKCAAGTGAFLEEIAYRLDLPLSELDGLARRFTQEVTIGSYCTVFASTEILARIRDGVAVEDLARAAFASVIRRVLEMFQISGEVVLTGGVIEHNPLMVEMLAQQLQTPPLVPPSPQTVGALGAALLAAEQNQ